jgi:cytochrome d ubiquinol oxidase subunit II
VLVGLALYAILGGADFGAGLWQLTTLVGSSGSAERRERIREHAHHAIGPVWEANHVWLIFVLTVTWTAYPRAFGAIASTLAVPLMLAGLGIVFRGAAYALRAGTATPREAGTVDAVFALSSILTPFALGALVGALAARRVPVGNAAGGLISSWTAATPLLVGVLFVAISAYTAAVYLAADAARHGEDALAPCFRARALGAGALAGAAAIAVLPALHADAHPLYARLLDGPGLVGVAISVLGGAATIALVLARRFEPARITAALAVAGMIVGWVLAQEPLLLPHLTVRQAAAPHDVLVLLLVVIAIGAAILFPSLAFLFGLVLGGRFDPGRAVPATADGIAVAAAAPLAAAPLAAAPLAAFSAPTAPAAADSSAGGLFARVAVAGLLAGLGLLAAADAPWAHALGVVCLFVCAVTAFLAVDPLATAEPEEDQ